MTATFAVQWTCDRAACFTIAWTPDVDTLPQGWRNWPGPKPRHLCDKCAPKVLRDAT